jgi:bisphosphoglycerate-independent phosphoglycerate mutase (AlkP superfamily)
MTNQPKPLVLLIPDTLGIRRENDYDIIALAKTPGWDCSGEFVRLSGNQMGNFGVGHLQNWLVIL